MTYASRVQLCRLLYRFESSEPQGFKTKSVVYQDLCLLSSPRMPFFLVKDGVKSQTRFIYRPREPQGFKTKSGSSKHFWMRGIELCKLSFMEISVNKFFSFNYPNARNSTLVLRKGLFVLGLKTLPHDL